MKTPWETSRIINLLRTAGSLAEQNRLSGKSLSCSDRQYIDCARSYARNLGLSEMMRTQIEEEGREIIRRNCK